MDASSSCLRVREPDYHHARHPREIIETDELVERGRRGGRSGPISHRRAGRGTFLSPPPSAGAGGEEAREVDEGLELVKRGRGKRGGGRRGGSRARRFGTALGSAEGASEARESGEETELVERGQQHRGGRGRQGGRARRFRKAPGAAAAGFPEAGAEGRELKEAELVERGQGRRGGGQRGGRRDGGTRRFGKELAAAAGGSEEARAFLEEALIQRRGFFKGSWEGLGIRSSAQGSTLLVYELVAERRQQLCRNPFESLCRIFSAHPYLPDQTHP